MTRTWYLQLCFEKRKCEPVIIREHSQETWHSSPLSQSNYPHIGLMTCVCSLWWMFVMTLNVDQNIFRATRLASQFNFNKVNLLSGDKHQFTFTSYYLCVSNIIDNTLLTYLLISITRFINRSLTTTLNLNIWKANTDTEIVRIWELNPLAQFLQDHLVGAQAGVQWIECKMCTISAISAPQVWE